MKYRNQLRALSLVPILFLGGCNSSSNTETTSGNVEGKCDEKISTMFYDFELSEPYTTTELNGYTADEDKEYLVVKLGLENTDTVEFTITSAEFCVAWGEGEDDYIAPLTYYEDTEYDENQMPASYNIASGEVKDWLLIYEVPSDQNDFVIYCTDTYVDKDGNQGTGAEYDISFTAEQR